MRTIIDRSLMPLDSSRTLRAVDDVKKVRRCDDNSHRKVQNLRGDSWDVSGNVTRRFVGTRSRQWFNNRAAPLLARDRDVRPSCPIRLFYLRDTRLLGPSTTTAPGSVPMRINSSPVGAMNMLNDSHVKGIISVPVQFGLTV
jgi:hypothetical protein